MITCKICNQDVASSQELAKHVRKDHDLTEKKYCLETLAKRDLLNGKPIAYKSLEQYLLTDFEGRANLLRWLKESNQTDAGTYLFKHLTMYAEIKNLTVLPSHFELRTISCLVSAKTYLHFFGSGFYLLSEQCGLKSRYCFHMDLKPAVLPTVIFEDTREKKPIKFGKNVNVEIKKLDYGDYSAGGDLYVERKSLSDLLGTLSAGWTRFQNEMDRAKEKGHYIVILVDTDINSFMSFNYGQHMHTKATPEFIFKRCRDLCRAYPDTIQFLFSGGRKDSAKVIPTLLGWGKKTCSGLDLQYYKDTGALDRVCG